MPLCTIGYEGIDINGFMSLLHRHAVQTVVDVREVPLSRKPGFSKKTLSDTLKICGLQYVHPIFLSYPVATSGEIGGEMIGGDFFFGLAAMILSTI